MCSAWIAIAAAAEGNAPPFGFGAPSPLITAGVGVGLAVSGFLLYRKQKISKKSFRLALILALGFCIFTLLPGLATVPGADSPDIPPAALRIVLLLAILCLFSMVMRYGSKAETTKNQLDRLLCGMAADNFCRDYPNLVPLPAICVVIPAYNEAKNVGRVLAQMPKDINGRKLIAVVIDDGSDDGTAAVVKAAGVPVVKSPVRRGGGAALRAGYEIAKRSGAEIVVTMDADGQHLPEEIPRLVTPILEAGCQVVLGSRVLGHREKDDLARWLGIHFFNGLIRLLSGIRVTDCANGFRAIHVEALKRVHLSQDQYHSTELIIEAAKKGIPLGEVPITVLKRHSGESKKGGNWTYGFRFAATILKTWWR